MTARSGQTGDMFIVPSAGKLSLQHEPKSVSVRSSAGGLRRFLDPSTPAKLPFRKLQSKSGPKRLLELALISSVPATVPTHQPSLPKTSKLSSTASTPSTTPTSPGQSFPTSASLMSGEAPLPASRVQVEVDGQGRNRSPSDPNSNSDLGPRAQATTSLSLDDQSPNLNLSMSPATTTTTASASPQTLALKSSPSSQRKPPGSWKSGNAIAWEEHTTPSWSPSLDSMHLFSIAESSSTSGDSERDADIGRSLEAFDTLVQSTGSDDKSSETNEANSMGSMVSMGSGSSDDKTSSKEDSNASNDSHDDDNKYASSKLDCSGRYGNDVTLTLVRMQPGESMCGAEWSMPVKEVATRELEKMESSTFKIFLEDFGELRFKMRMENGRVGLECLSVVASRTRAVLAFAVSVGPSSGMSVLTLSSFLFRNMRSTWWGSSNLDFEKLSEANPNEPFLVRILVQNAMPALTPATEI